MVIVVVDYMMTGGSGGKVGVVVAVSLELSAIPSILWRRPLRVPEPRLPTVTKNLSTEEISLTAPFRLILLTFISSPTSSSTSFPSFLLFLFLFLLLFVIYISFTRFLLLHPLFSSLSS